MLYIKIKIRLHSDVLTYLLVLLGKQEHETDLKTLLFFFDLFSKQLPGFWGKSESAFFPVFFGIDISCRSGSQFVDITNLAEVGACPQRGHRFSGAADEGIQQGAGKSRVQ